jgi:hypothetical protein
VGSPNLVGRGSRKAACFTRGNRQMPNDMVGYAVKRAEPWNQRSTTVGALLGVSASFGQDHRLLRSNSTAYREPRPTKLDHQSPITNHPFDARLT